MDAAVIVQRAFHGFISAQEQVVIRTIKRKMK